MNNVQVFQFDLHPALALLLLMFTLKRSLTPLHSPTSKRKHASVSQYGWELILVVWL